MTMLNRRKFIGGGAAIGGLAASSFPSPALSKGRKELRLAMAWPKNFPGLATSPQRFAKRFEIATEGRYKVRVLGTPNKLFDPLKCLDAVQQGTVHMYHAAEYYNTGKSPAFAFFTTVPFGFTAAEQDGWMHFGGGQQLWDELAAQYGVKGFSCGQTGAQMGGWAKKPLRTLDDMKGLRIRMPGLGGDVMRALDAAPVNLAGTDIMPALSAGRIDATEWVGPYNDLAFGFYKVAKHYHYPGFHEPGPTLSLGVSKKLYDGMTKQDQAILEACALTENNIDLAEYMANNARAMNILINKHKVQLHEFSDELFKAASEASKDVVAKAGSGDDLSRRIYESYSKFRKLSLEWAKYSDQSYMVKRAKSEQNN